MAEYHVTYSTEAACLAAVSGHVDALRYLMTEQGCETNIKLWTNALQGGFLPVLQFLLEHCPELLGPSAYNEIRHYHDSDKAVRLIRWLYETAHLQWDAMQLARHAVERGHLELLAYLKQQGVVWSPHQLTTLLQCGGTAACYQGMNCLQWLRDEGAAWPDALGWHGEDLESVRIYRWSDAAVAWAMVQGVCCACDRGPRWMLGLC